MNPGWPRLAMVLAAGLGKRMRPYTETLPKPLVRVAGRTLVDRVLDRFETYGIERVVVNVHHHRGRMESHLHARPRPPIVLSPESDLLETGGGVKNALPYLGAAPFFVANADNLWLDGRTPTLVRMARAWNDGRMDALLLLNSGATAFGYEGLGDFFCDAEGRLRRRREREIAPDVYAGLHIVHPRLFEHAPSGAFSLNDVWDLALAEGRLFGLLHDGQWFHVGTPEGLAIAEAELGPARPAREET